MRKEKVIYKVKPYILLSKENMVMSAGSKIEMDKLQSESYYSDCQVEIRKHDLYVNDNTKHD